MTHTILGIQLKDRHSTANDVQNILTEYGCIIKTRIGLHDVHGDKCSPTGIIVLELHGEEKEIKKLISKLGSVKGLRLKKMIF
jgi:metal-responsive CopG/Arc/MetJ family transcriptional regulator